jgi:thiol-disulfide isomerase/thioredoxin
MAHFPKPFFRSARNAWFVQIGSRQIKLGADKDEAFRQYHQLMVAPQEIPAVQIPSKLVVVVVDAFLDYVEKHLAADTFRWYRDRLQNFVEQIPATLTVLELKPFHVQQWIDSFDALACMVNQGTVIYRNPQWKGRARIKLWIVSAFVLCNLIITPIGKCETIVADLSLAATRPTGRLAFDAELTRYGPLPSTLPSDFNSDDTVAHATIESLRQNAAYRALRMKEPYAKPVLLPVKGNKLESEQIAEGIYSIYLQSYEIQEKDCGRVLIGRSLRLLAIHAGNRTVNLGVLRIVAFNKYLRVGDPAPDTVGTTLSGKPFSLSLLRDRWTIVDFWATWCPACLETLPEIARIRKRFPDANWVGMSFDDKPDDVEHFLQGKNYNWTQVFLGPMEESAIPRAWGFVDIPQMFLVSPSGRISGSELSTAELERILQGVYGEPR